MKNAQKDTTAKMSRSDHHWWRTVSTFAPDWWSNRRLVLTAYLASAVAVTANILAPWPLSLVIDKALVGLPLPGPLAALTDGLSTASLIILLAVSYALIEIAGTAGSALEQKLNARAGERMSLRMRDRLLNHVQLLPLSHRTTDRSGEIVLRIVDDVTQFVRLLTKTVPVIVRHLTLALVILGVMFWLEPWLGLFGLGIVIFMAWMARHYVGPLRAASRTRRRCDGDVSGLLQEIMRGLPSIQILGAERRVRERFGRVNARSLQAGVHEVDVAVDMERTMGITKGIAMASIVGVGGLLVSHGNLTIGGLTVAVSYLAQLLRPVAKLNDLASAVTRGLARGDQLVALLDRAPAVQDRPDAVDVGRAEGVIELRDVSFAYPDPTAETTAEGEHGPMLHGVSLRLSPGQLAVLVGPSGSGKSTLLGLLVRLFEPTAGEISLDGVPYHRIRLNSLRAQFAVMLQETHLFSGSVRDALQPVAREASDAELWEALTQVDLADVVRQLTGELDARLGENAVNLSGGQRARLSLARALLVDCPILLLDEPLANVDPDSQQIILDALDRVRNGRTCLAVTHQSALTERADVLLTLSGRQIVADQSPPNVHPLPVTRCVNDGGRNTDE